MKDVQYRIVQFIMADNSKRYVAMAWNYDLALLIATSDHETYTAARFELGQLCAARNVRLRWFDGEYVRHPGDDAMYPAEPHQLTVGSN